jgi:hypothetical protein
MWSCRRRRESIDPELLNLQLLNFFLSAWTFTASLPSLIISAILPSNIEFDISRFHLRKIK